LMGESIASDAYWVSGSSMVVLEAE